MLRKFLQFNDVKTGIRWVRRRAQPEWLQGVTKYLEENKIFQEAQRELQIDVGCFFFKFLNV